jgi:hypothetical protein
LTILSVNNCISQTDSIVGLADKKGFKQGYWTYYYSKRHPKLPIYEPCIEKRFYVNDTVQKEIFFYSKDSSTTIITIPFINNKKNGMGFYFHNGRIRETYYFNDSISIVHEFGYKGGLIRTYKVISTATDEVFDEYDVIFDKGKKWFEKKYNRGVLLYEIKK